MIDWSPGYRDSVIEKIALSFERPKADLGIRPLSRPQLTANQTLPKRRKIAISGRLLMLQQTAG